MNMSERLIIKHQRMTSCDKNTKMWWQRRDVASTDKFLEETFSLTGEGKEWYALRESEC